MSTAGISNLFVGTSGWTYDHWRGIFYPEKIAKTKWFEFYCQHFSTVELNNSFYRIPNVKAVESWDRRSPEQFCFAVKMSRLVTHVKKLANCEKELEWFFSVFEPLKSKIGIHLIQLPPSLHYNPDRLQTFISLLPTGTKCAFEFRHASWYVKELYDLLERNDHTFVIHDWDNAKTDIIVTTGRIYIRFHGAAQMYGGDYQDQELKKWAHWIIDQREKKKIIFAYFNNDIGGFAIKNAQRLIELVSK